VVPYEVRTERSGLGRGNGARAGPTTGRVTRFMMRFHSLISVGAAGQVRPLTVPASRDAGPGAPVPQGDPLPAYTQTRRSPPQP